MRMNILSVNEEKQTNEHEHPIFTLFTLEVNGTKHIKPYQLFAFVAMVTTVRLVGPVSSRLVSSRVDSSTG